MELNESGNSREGLLLFLFFRRRRKASLGFVVISVEMLETGVDPSVEVCQARGSRDTRGLLLML